MCTAAIQKNLPDILTNLDGTSVTIPDRVRPIGGADVPLNDGSAVEELTIRRRRERLRQAESNPGSNIPTLIRTRKDILDEIT